MDSETILKTLHTRLQLQRYANNTVKSVVMHKYS